LEIALNFPFVALSRDFSLAIPSLYLIWHLQTSSIATILIRSLTMAHSNENIESALRAAIKDTVGNGEEDVLTVRYIRGRVEESLKLVEGFFVTDAWKAKSKQIIKVYAVSCS
jgi:hypothetical protein